MNFLAGPLTRMQIPALNRLARQSAPEKAPPIQQAPMVESYPLDEFQPIPAAPSAAPPPATAAPAPPSVQAQGAHSSTKPQAPAGVREVFLPNNLTFSQALKATGRQSSGEIRWLGLVYLPLLLGQASIRFLNRKYSLDYDLHLSVQVPAPDRRGVVRWESFLSPPVDLHVLDDQPAPQSRFAPLDAPLSDAKTMSALQKDFLDWAYRRGRISLPANESLKVYGSPQDKPEAFTRALQEGAGQAYEAEAKKISDGFDKKIAALEVRLRREERELSEDQTRLQQRRMEEMGTHAENVFGVFTRKGSSRKLSTSLTKRRLTEQAKAAVDESTRAIADFKRQIEALEKEREQALKEASQRWQASARDVSEVSLAALKKDVHLELFGVAWMPYHRVDFAGTELELEGYA
jgi:hypothetical protein